MKVKKGRISSRRVALLAILTSAALCSFLIENLFPPILVPGAKLGIGNVFVMLAMILCGGPDAIFVVVVKSVLGCIIVGNMGACIYSLSAGLVSTTIMLALYIPTRKVSLVAISVFSAVVHNLVQNAVFCIVTESEALFALAPYLVIIGIISGFAVGVTVYLTVKKIPLSVFEKITGNVDKNNKTEDLR